MNPSRVDASLFAKQNTAKSVWRATGISFILNLKSKNQISKSDLERGLRSLQHKHPVLFCTPHRENEKHWLEEDPTLRIPIFERERLNDETFREVYLAEIEGKPMEPGVCPNKVFVFQRELIEEKEIGLFLAHFFCDGFSFFNAFCHLLEVAFESPEREVKVTQTYALDCDSVFDREWQANGFGYLSFITNLGKALYRYIDNPFR